MKRRSVSRKKKLVKSRSRKGKASNKRRGLDLEILDDRLLLDADGLAITSPSTAEIRSGLTNVMNVTADDPAVTFSISGGDDAGQFSIDPALGSLSFNSAPDHSSPADTGADNVYDVTVQVQDSFTNVVNQPIAITVLPPNVAPQVTAGTYNVFENELLVGTVTATDANTGDAGGDTLTFSFANTSDAETFQIDSNTGVLSFVAPPDFESGNTSYNVDVTATDALGSTDTATQAITILNVDEPVVGNDGNVIFPAGQTASNTGTWSHPTGANVLLYATSGTVTKTGGGTWSWTGPGPSTASEVRFVTVGGVDDAGNAATTTFSVSGQNTAPIVEIDNNSVTVSESDTATNSGLLSDLDGDVVTLFSTAGTIVDQGDGTWNWSLATTDGPVESQYVGIIATDSYGSSRARSFQLIVQNVAPTIAVDAATVTAPEGTTATNSGTYTDLGDDVVTVTSDIGTVTTNPDGTWNWSYLAPNGYASETVTLTATDSDGATATETFTLETLNVPPTITADVATVTITEGDSATVTGTMSDQAIPEDTLTLTASIGTVTPGVGTWQWDYTSTDGPDESATVTITADDGDGGISVATFDLVVNNAAPTVAVDNATVTVTEGATANNTGTVADAGADTTSLSASRGTVVDNGDGTWSWSLATQDGPDDSGTITITATDSDGDVSTVQFALTVDNAAPTIAVDGAPATVTVAEGGLASLTGIYSEAGPADPVSLSASVGTIVDNGDGTWAWSLATTDGTDESQTVTVTITDSEGAAGTDTFALVVNNVAPAIAVAENTVTVDEGTTATNTITVTDPGDDTIQTLTTSLGTPTDNGDGTWSWAYLAPNGPNTQTVTVTATDSDGDTTTLDFTLQTNNVAPVVAADIPLITINEGETATVTGTMSDQAVPEDAITLTSSLDGSGATITPGSGTWSWNFTAADGEGLTQTVTVTAEDADSATSQTTFDLIVNNLPAALTVANSTVTVDEGQVAANSGTFSDPGVDVVTLTASLGTVVDAGGGNWTWSHTTSDGPADTQTVTITATDSDAAVSTISFDLTVDNVAPTIAADNATVSATEGSTASNSGTFGDAGTDVLTLTADRGTVVDNGNGTWNWSLDTTDGPDETGSVTITVTDADGATTDITFALTVTNVAPTIAADQAGVTINESETANMTGTHGDAGDDIVSLTASVGSVSDNGDGTWSWSFTSTDGPAETQVVTITAEDHDGLSSTATFNLTVQNVAPSVASDNATVTVNEGETAMNTGTYADVGADTVSLAADVGAIVDNGDGTWSWSFTTSDGPDDTQTVTVTATDSDGATTSSTFALVVQNIASVLDADNATVTVGEGTTATNTGTITDAGGDAATLSASVGTVTNNGDDTWNWSLVTTDGTEDSQTVTITATDDDGDVSTTTFELAVNNLPAALTVDTATVTVSEGATATNTGTYADPGDDTVTLAVSVGTISDTGGGGWSWSFATTDGATETQLVTVTATDSDGEVSTTTFNLTVNNVDPTLVVDNATVTVSEGALAGNSGTFADIGDDTVTVTASVGTITQDDQAGTWQWSFQTTDGVDDSQTVTITAADEDGGSVSQQFNLVVNNLAPTVFADNATVTAAEGTTATNSGTFADAGGDAVTITADSGAVTQDNGTGTWSWSLTTTDGVDDSRTVTITATDDDGDASTVTFQLDVTNTAPNVTVANATVEVAEGSTATNSGTFADDGADTVTLTASVGTITQDNPGGTWSWNYSTTDGPDDSQQVDITATDSDGATTIASFQLNAINVAPTISTDSSFVSVNEGETATNTGTMADVGNDTVTLSASVGDVVDNGDGTWAWSFATTDGTEQSGPVTITATDDDGEQTTTSFTLIVSNLAPTVSVDNPSVTTTEGAVASNSGLFDDAGDDTVELSASIGEVVDSGGGIWNWTWTANDGPDDTGAVTITATDSDGAATTATFFIQVDNVAPTLTVDSAAITVNEAATAGNSGSMGDVGNDTVTIAASVGTVTDNGNGTWNWEFTPTDGPDDSQTVTITVTDSDNVSTSVDFALTVDNVAPDLVINTDPVVVVEGSTATNDGTILDAGADVVTLTATSGTITDNGDGTWSWSYDSTDGPDETQVISITAEDEDSATTVGTFQLTVTNAAAVLTADNATVNVTEGATATNTGTVVDAGDDNVVVTASVGTITENAGTWSWSYDSTDGPDESQTVTITSTDSDGATSDVTFELVVDNVAPAVTADNATLQIAEGSLGTNTGTFSDIGADVVNLSVDVGIITQDNGAGTWGWQWTPVDGPTTQIVTVTATDSDGQATSSTFTVTVDNVDPTIAADNATVVVSENAMATNTGTVTDPGDDELTISASLGTATLDQGGTWQWQYAAVDGPDSQTVTITITDSDGGTNQTTFDLTVNNVAPVISADNATVTVNESGTANNTGTFMDVGANDTVTLSASLGTIVDNGNGTWNWSHTPADGPDESATITVTATDSDGAQSSQQFDLVVTNVAPDVNVNEASVSVTEGQTATNTGTYGDVGADTVSLSADLGQLTDNGDGTWSWSYNTTDGPDDSQNVVVTATDSDGDTSIAEFTLTVENAAPSVAADNATVTTTEGSAVTNTGTYGDVGADSITLTASLGAVTDNGDGTWSWTHTPSNGPADSGMVTITATDSDGATSTVDFAMVVTNVGPIIATDNSTIAAVEGVNATNTGTFSDVGSDVLLLTASIGTVVDNGDGTWSWSHTPDNGHDSVTVTITATDEDDEAQSVSFDMTVSNAAPALSINNSTVTATQGALAANSGSYSDTPTDTVTLSSSLGQVVDNGDGTWSWSLDTSDSEAGASSVDITATDNDGDSSTMSFNLTIENAPPVVTIDTAVVTVSEGSAATNQGTLSDAGGDALTITASYGNVTDNGDGTWDWFVATTDGPDESTTVVITVTDPSGADATESFELNVENVAPTITADAASVGVEEGETATNSGTFGDLGADTVTLSASVGTVLDNGDGTWSWSLGTVDGPTESQVVIITATDSDQLDTSATFDLVVTNAAPVIAVDNPIVTVNEGETATNTGSFGDAGDDALLLSASVGEVTDLGAGQWTWNYIAGDGPADSQIVTISVDDGDGGAASTTFQLNVDDLPPTLSIDQAVVSAQEGQAAANTGTFDDPGDGPVNIVASIGEITVDEQAGSWSWSYVAGDGPDDSQTVTLTATDNDGAQTTETFQLDITNVAPSISATEATVTVNEGQVANNSGEYSDLQGDSVTLSVSVGTIVDNGDGTWSWSASAADGPADSQTVTVTATDEDGGSQTAQFDLVVENLAPSISVNTSQVTVFEGTTATQGGAFIDVAGDTVSLSASVGTVVDNGDGTWSWSFNTLDGPEESQTVTVTATDKDGASDSRIFDLNVLNLDPLIDADEDLILAVAGTTATNSGTWGDFGNGTVALSATAGTVTQNPDGTWDWQLPDVQNTQDVTVTVTDDDGDFRSLTFEVRAQSPTIDIDGNVAVILSTDLDDSITVTPGTTTHQVEVSGFTFNLDATVITELHLGGGLGDNSVQITGTTGDDDVTAGDDRVTAILGSLTVETYSMDTVIFDGVVGQDIARLSGTSGADRLEGTLGDITLTTPDASYRVINVDRVNAYGSHGQDIADVQGTSGNEFFLSLPEHSYIENPASGTRNFFKDFEDITVDGLGNTDYTRIQDSAGDDQFSYFDTHMAFVSASRNITLTSFEVSTIESVLGGNDVGSFVIESGLNHLATSLPTEFQLTQGTNSTRVLGYDAVVAQATNGTGTNSASIQQVAAVETLFASGSQATMTSRGLTLDGFDPVTAEANAGESPTLDDDQAVDYLLNVIGNWL